MNKTHGMSNTSTYRSWRDMKSRCHNKKNKSFKNYGGRSIFVCQKWRNGFINFLKDMGEKPEGKTLERIENNKGYFKENCRWATYLDQLNNTRSNFFIIYKNDRMTIAQASRRFSIGKTTLLSRIKVLKWSVEKAIESPTNAQ